MNRFFQGIRLKNILMLTAAGIINAFGVVLFLSPVHLYDSGISGTSMLLSELTPDFLPLSFFLVIINVPLFLFGTKRQGRLFTIYAVYVVSVYSLFALLFRRFLPEVGGSPFAGQDILLCAVFGGLFSGIGSGVAIRYGGAMDGMEVMAVIFAKRLSVTVGTFVMAYNVVLYIFCGIFTGSFTLPLYSVVTYTVGLKAVDFIVEGIDRSKAATIITTEPAKVAAALSEAFGCGITVLKAKGYYSGSDRALLYLVINRFELGRMKQIVLENDPKAYVTIAEIADVFKANTEAPDEPVPRVKKTKKAPAPTSPSKEAALPSPDTASTEGEGKTN